MSLTHLTGALPWAGLRKAAERPALALPGAMISSLTSPFLPASTKAMSWIGLTIFFAWLVFGLISSLEQCSL